MKSHELTLIRTEGLDSKDLQFFVYIGHDCYGKLELNGCNSLKTLVLPASGRLGLRVCQGRTLVGQTFVDFLSLEQNGLQWLPILSHDSGPIHELPEEVPCPRVLISIYSSKSKTPGRPVEGLGSAWPAFSLPDEMEKLELLGDLEEANQEKKTQDFEISKPPEKTELETVSSENLAFELKKETPGPLNSFQHLFKTEQVKSSALSTKTGDFLQHIDENLENLEEIIENLNLDLHKSQKKNFQKKRTIRELKLKLSVLHQKMKNLEKNEDQNVSQYLTEKLLNTQENFLELQETLESQACQISELQGVISNQVALLNDKEDVIRQQESILNEQDLIIKELEASQSEFESILEARALQSEQKEASLKETIKSLESRLKESVKSLDMLETTFKETTAKTINLEIAFYELQQQRKSSKEGKDVCSNCEKLQVEIKGHLENTKRLYQSIQIASEKLNTSEFHNQELIIINQDLSQENQALNKELLERKSRETASLCSPFNPDTVLSNFLPRDEIDDLFQQQFPVSYSRSLKLVPEVYLISSKKVKITKTHEKLQFFQDNQEIFLSDLESKHEKNSLSLEDVSNQLEYKSQNLIHNRVTRENKLRVLTKQW